jgi:hypothetical protein
MRRRAAAGADRNRPEFPGFAHIVSRGQGASGFASVFSEPAGENSARGVLHPGRARPALRRFSRNPRAGDFRFFALRSFRPFFF